jgi:acyl-[acyl-carrier-protein] desaturase
MSSEAASTLSQREVLSELSEFVRENLPLLLPIEKAWQPTDYLPDLTAADWREQLNAFRAAAEQLSDEVLIVLVGDMVTEEALPSYAVSLNVIAEDRHGNSDTPWARWLRGWTAEENRHGDLLNAYLRLTGRVDMRAVEVTINHLLNKGFETRAYPDLYAGLVYTAFQERATQISHNNVGKLAIVEGNEALGGICRRIAGDESRHETFYTRVMGEVLRRDPAAGVATISAMLRRIISMPGKLMYDGKDPNLFDHFAIVAQRLGVYTTLDYASIVRHLVQAWNVATFSLTGAAARAQDFLCGYAERIETHAERMSDRLAEEPRVPFSWIHDRLA